MLKNFVKTFSFYEREKYYKNVRITAIAPSYVNTSCARNMYNPSAIKGDLVHQRFVIGMNRINDASMSPEITAKAILEASTLLTMVNNTEYLNPPLNGRTTSDIFHNIYVNDYRDDYIKDTRAMYKAIGNSIGVDLDINAALAK
jgi:hypothetical protein